VGPSARIRSVGALRRPVRFLSGTPAMGRPTRPGREERRPGRVSDRNDRCASSRCRVGLPRSCWERRRIARSRRHPRGVPGSKHVARTLRPSPGWTGTARHGVAWRAQLAHTVLIGAVWRITSHLVIIDPTAPDRGHEGRRLRATMGFAKRVRRSLR
jgi:hypothetical protein